MWGRGTGCLGEPVSKEGRIRSQVNFPLEETGTCAPCLPPSPTPPTSEIDFRLQGGDREEAKVGGGVHACPHTPGRWPGLTEYTMFCRYVWREGGRFFKVTASSLFPSPHYPPPTPQVRLRCFLGAQGPGPFLLTPRVCTELGGGALRADAVCTHAHNISGLNKTS